MMEEGIVSCKLPSGGSGSQLLIMSAQARATSFLDEVKRSPSCLELCLTRFSSSPYIEVKFWCLQTLHEVKSLASLH